MTWIFNVIAHIEYIQARLAPYTGAANYVNNYNPIIEEVTRHCLYVEAEASYANIIDTVMAYGVPPGVARELVDTLYFETSNLIDEFLEGHPIDDLHFNVYVDFTGSLYIMGIPIRAPVQGDSTYMPDDSKDALPYDPFDFCNDYIPERMR